MTRQIYLTKTFKRDAKKHYLDLLTANWSDVFYALLNDTPLDPKYKDHSLTGELAEFRDCHVKPDLVLIYRIVGDVVQLHQLGTHSKIFG